MENNVVLLKSTLQDFYLLNTSLNIYSPSTIRRLPMFRTITRPKYTNPLQVHLMYVTIQ